MEHFREKVVSSVRLECGGEELVTEYALQRCSGVALSESSSVLGSLRLDTLLIVLASQSENNRGGTLDLQLLHMRSSSVAVYSSFFC